MESRMMEKDRRIILIPLDLKAMIWLFLDKNPKVNWVPMRMATGIICLIMEGIVKRKYRRIRVGAAPASLKEFSFSMISTNR